MRSRILKALTALLLMSGFLLAPATVHAVSSGKDLFDQSIGIDPTGRVEDAQTGGNVSTPSSGVQDYALPYQKLLGGFIDQSEEGGSFEGFVADIILIGVDRFIIIISVIAILFVVISGFQMVTSGGNEENAKKQWTVIRNVIIGIVFMNLANAIVSNLLFNSQDPAFRNEQLAAREQVSTLLSNFCTAEAGSEACGAAQARMAPVAFSTEVVLPVMQFVLSFLAAFAILYIIIAAFNIVMARGEGDKVKEGYRTIINGMIGFALVILSRGVVDTVYGTPFTINASGEAEVTQISPDLLGGISIIMNISNFILGFFSVIAIVMYIYAGVLIVTAGVKEDNKKKGYTIMKWTTLGILLAMSSYAIVSTLVRLNT